MGYVIAISPYAVRGCVDERRRNWPYRACDSPALREGDPYPLGPHVRAHTSYVPLLDFFQIPDFAVQLSEDYLKLVGIAL